MKVADAQTRGRLTIRVAF